MARKVMVALSGGVDSAVAALLLKQQGYEVCGFTLKLAGNDVADARAVCGRLGMEHQVLDFAGLFKHKVIQPFAAAYAQGLTPNPCIFCNRNLKFGALLSRACELGADALATGHYARVEFDDIGGRWLLKKAADPAKDQSYVLYALNQEQLSRLLFPLGELSKSETRALATASGLVNADKPDSQDICFIADGDYAGYLTRELGVSSPPGDFVDTCGRVLGQHRGLIHYTIGQRKGIGIAFGQPRYVVALDAKSNTVTLGEERDLCRDSLIADDVNFIAVARLTAPLRVSVKTRYKQKETPATIHPLPDGRVEVRFEQPQRAITPGQAVVFYDGEIVVGGGTIV